MTTWRRPGRVGRAVYAALAGVVGAVLALVSRLRIERGRSMVRVAERLPDGPIIVVANHTSYADGLLLALICRRLGRPVRLLATGGVFRVPLVGRLARTVGFIPVERGTSHAADALDAAADALAAGEAVGLFPEGRITRDRDRWPERSRTGAVRLALRTGAPIIPVAIVGAHRVIDRRHIAGRLMLNAVLRPRVRSRVGDPIDVHALLGRPTPEAVRAAADAVMESLIDLIEDVRGEIAPDPIGIPPSPTPPQPVR